MAFEIFDDVAFFFVAQIIMGLFVVPPTLYLIGAFLWSKAFPQKHDRLAKAGKCECAECLKKSKLLSTEKSSVQKYFTVKWILFVIGWILFIWMTTQLPQMQGERLATFNPWQILELEEGAELAEIKKAFRALSLKYHPDKNPDPDAQQKFILLSKAYNTLTDPVAQENIQKFGNPDGYQGVSVTIGLPSFLTKKENEVKVLLIYFLIFIVLPPTLVFFWWQKASQFHETGAMNESVGLFFHTLNENMSSKQMLEILSAAAEYRLFELRPDPPEFKGVTAEVKEYMAKPKFKKPRPYINTANVLLHAHLLRVPLSEALQKDLHVILKDTHKLLNVMLDMSLSRGYHKVVFNSVELMQLITQALWVHSHPLKQLPHLTERELKAFAKKGIGSIDKFKVTSQEKKEKICPEHAKVEWDNIQSVCDLLPDLEVEHACRVEDEAGIFEGDIVLLTVTLTRMAPRSRSIDDSEGAPIEWKPISKGDDDDDDTPASKPEEPDKDKDAKPDKDAKDAKPDKASPEKTPRKVIVSRKEKKDAKKAPGAGEDKKDSGTGSEAHDSALGGGGGGDADKEKEGKDKDKDADSKTADRVDTSASINSEDATPRKRKKRNAKEDDLDFERRIADLPLSVKKPPPAEAGEPPLAHAVHFPYPKVEKWFVFLVETTRTKQQRIIGFERVRLVSKQLAEIRFRASTAGETKFEVHVMNDSYVGCDKVVSFKLKVEKRRGAQPQITQEKEKEEEEDEDEEDDNEPEAPPAEPKWYYLWGTSFWELLLNVFVLFLVGVFAVNFLQSRGWWQSYFQPPIDKVTRVLAPFYNRVADITSPVVVPLLTPVLWIWKWLSDKLTVDVVQPPKKKSKRRGGRRKATDPDEYDDDEEEF